MYMNVPHEMHAAVNVVCADGTIDLTTPYEYIREWLWLNETQDAMIARIVAYELADRPDLSDTVREHMGRDRYSDLMHQDREQLLETVMDNLIEVGISKELRNGFYTDLAGQYAVWLPAPLPY